MSAFRRAERKKAKLRAALCGPAGSGKTYSSLLLAQGLGGKIAMIDTERGSGELYSSLGDYDVAQIEAPYTPQKYVSLIKEAAREYDVIIIDSLSHAWAGEGGVLDMHTGATAAQRTKNSYTAWREVTPAHNTLVEAILTAPCHVISCMRSKMAYEQSDIGGKKTVQKLGMAPIQREGMEYEFTLVLDINVEHYAVSTKDRTGLWAVGRGEVIIPAHGKELLEWLESGSPDNGVRIGQSSQELMALELKIAEFGLSLQGVEEWTSRHWQVFSLAGLTVSQRRELIEKLPEFAIKKIMKRIPVMDRDEAESFIKTLPNWILQFPDELDAALNAAQSRLEALEMGKEISNSLSQIQEN